MRTILVLVAIATASVRSARAERNVFVGITARTDLGTHAFRLSTASRIRCVWLNVALDPYGLIADTQHDTDLFAEWPLRSNRYALVTGWRAESVPLLGTRYWGQKQIIGVTGEIPYRLWDRVRFRFSTEIAFTLVQHGSGLPTVWAWQHDQFVRNSFDVGMFLRVEYGFGGSR